MPSNWQETFFRGVALDAWRRIINPETTSKEVDFLKRALAIGAGARLLDIPCGNGHHAIEFARRGYKMTGLDLSEEFIAEARAVSEAAGIADMQWLCGDMRAISWVSEFDGAYCFGNSFAYFNYDEARQFLAAVARALKPGGRFIVDTGMAAESILPSLQRTRWYRLGDILMLSENRYDPAESRLDIDYTFVRNGEVEMRPTSSYAFTTGELCRMHRDAGLRPVELLGSINREPYQLGSPRLILVSARQ
jgi:SAM-dependent methyltransferase